MLRLTTRTTLADSCRIAPSGRIMFHCRKEITSVNTAFAWSGVALLFVALTSGCSARRGDAILPTSSAPDAPSVSASPAGSDAAVRQSYTGYWAVLPKAEHSDSATRRRQLLADYAIDPQLATALQGIDDLH